QPAVRRNPTVCTLRRSRKCAEQDGERTPTREQEGEFGRRGTGGEHATRRGDEMPRVEPPLAWHSGEQELSLLALNRRSAHPPAAIPRQYVAGGPATEAAVSIEEQDVLGRRDRHPGARRSGGSSTVEPARR